MSINQSLLQKSTLDVEETGYSFYPTGNFVSKLLWLYNCIHATSLGPQLIGTCFSSTATSFLKAAEYFDFLMHYLGCPVILIYLASTRRIKQLTLIVCLGAIFMHYLNMLLIMVVFAVPLSAISRMALFFPVDTDANISGNSCNTFLTITSREELRYQCSDEQRSIFFFAAAKGQIHFMIHNNRWTKQTSKSCYLNAFSHIVPLVLVILLIFFKSNIVGKSAVAAVGAGYGIFYICFWILIAYCTCLGECILSILCCCGVCCVSAKKTAILEDIRSHVEDGSVQSSQKLRPISGCCSYMFWL